MSDLTKVQQILNGSRRINEMKGEIKSFVSIINGFLHNNDAYEQIKKGKSKTFNLEDGSPVGTGNVLFYCKSEKYEFVVEYVGIPAIYVYPINGPKLPLFPQMEDVPLKYVQDIYLSLPLLLDEFIKIFPNLEQKIQPLLDAAKV